MAGGHRDERLRRMTVRFTEPSHAIVERAAARIGITFAQYVREAALMRAAYEAGLARGETDPPEAIRKGFEEIRARWEEHGRRD